MIDGLPSAFLARLDELLGTTQAVGVVEALTRERAVGFRINTLVASPETTFQRLADDGLMFTPLGWCAEAAVVSAEQRSTLTHHALVSDGMIYIQNPASMMPPLVLAPTAGERVLDLAAAPGSKTLQLAAMMENQGWISAVEAVRSRFHRLRANLERYGANNVHTYLKDGSSVWRHVPECFDKVLIDAPCSSEGQFRLDQPESYGYWSERKIKEMARKQQRLLYSAFQCLKPGGELVYSTCTLAPEENEGIVDKLVRRYLEALEILPIPLGLACLKPAISQWRGREYHQDLAYARRVLPDDVMEGFFLCRLRKTASTVDPKFKRPRFDN